MHDKSFENALNMMKKIKEEVASGEYIIIINTFLLLLLYINNDIQDV